MNRSDYKWYPPRLSGHSSAVWRDRWIILFGGQFEITHRVMDMLPIEKPKLRDTGINCTTLNNCTGYGYCRGNNSFPHCECVDGYTGHMCQLGMDYDLSSDVWMFDMQTEKWKRRRYAGDHSRLNEPRFDHWPTKRFHHTGVINGDVMYIYGGYGRDFVDYTNELWEYNINKFYALSDDQTGRWYKAQILVNDQHPRPSARWLHSACIVNRVVGGEGEIFMFMYGGMSMDKMLNETWRLAIDGPLTDQSYGQATTRRRWKKIPSAPVPGTKGPGARIRTSIIYHPVRDRIYVFGGFSSLSNYTSNYVDVGSQFFQDKEGEVFTMNLTTNLWSSIMPLGKNYAPPRMGHRTLLVLDSLVVFGGYWANKEYGDIWRFNLTSKYWIKQEYHYSITTFPTKRYEHTFAVRESTNYFYVFGGQTSRSTFGETRNDYRVNDMWKYDLLWCPNDCSNRGSCIFGYCFCEEGYYGYDCQNSLCQGSMCWYEEDTLKQACKFCSNRGECRDGVCRCMDGYEGEQCTDIFCEYDCYGRGNCTEIGQCIEYRWNYDLVTLSGGAEKILTDLNETVIYTGPPRTTSYITIPVQRRVTELAGINWPWKYQTIFPPSPGAGPIVSYYVHHKEGHNVVKSKFHTTESLDEYYRAVKKDQWSKEMAFKEREMNVYVSDSRTISIVIEIQNRERSLYIRPEVEYELCFLTKTKKDLQCECNDGFWGRLCEHKWCECSGHGSCKSINGTCECDFDAEGRWVGHNCSIYRRAEAEGDEGPYIPIGLFVTFFLFLVIMVNLQR